MKIKYAIIIAGDDTFVYEDSITARDFMEAVEECKYIIQRIDDRTIEKLRIASISEDTI